MSNLSFTWVTIKYQDQLFDIRLSKKKIIDEIRTVDSEINIAPMMNEKVKKYIQDKTR